MSMESRARCRAGWQCLPRSFAEALACQLQHADARLPAIATATGLRVSYLQHAASPYDPRHGLRADLLERLNAATAGHCPTLTYLASQAGGVFVPLPAPAATGEAVFEAFAAAVAELGEDATLLREVLADGVVTPGEEVRIAREIDETIAALCAVKGRARLRAATSRSAAALVVPSACVRARLDSGARRTQAG